MKVLVYERESHEPGNKFHRFLEEHVPGETLKVCRSIEGLREELMAPQEEEVVAVLLASTREDLAALFSLRHRLQEIKTILLAPDRMEETVALAHRIRPRFLGWVHNDFSPATAVLEKMLKNQG